MDISWGAHTQAGKRANNQDHLLAIEDTGLFAVADGMGGHAGGDVASRLAVESLRAYFARWGSRLPSVPPEAVVAGALRAANAAIHRCRSGDLATMGSTVATLWLRPDAAVIAHLGDSRVYRLRDGELDRLTRDHSLAELFRERGADEASARRVEHLLTRSLGQNAEGLRPELRTEAWVAGDVYLLCSDGLTTAVPERLIADALEHFAPRVAAVALVEGALEMGATDDVTAVVVRVCRAGSSRSAGLQGVAGTAVGTVTSTVRSPSSFPVSVRASMR